MTIEYIGASPFNHDFWVFMLVAFVLALILAIISALCIPQDDRGIP